MAALLFFLLTLFASPFKSKSRLEAENVALRHQLGLLRRMVPGRVKLTNNDRLFLVQLYRWFPSVLKAITIIRPETLIRWHRAGFCRYWRWKSLSVPKIRFCNSGDEGRRGRVQIRCGPRAGWRDGSERLC